MWINMLLRYWIAGLALFSTQLMAGQLRPEGEAPKDGMLGGTWSTGIKQFFGTAYESYDDQNRHSSHSSTAPISKVWFTGGQGVLTEIFWPTIDTPQTRDHQLLVSDGTSFFYEERRDSQTRVEWLHSGVPAFRVVNRDPKGRFEITKLIFADPDRDAVIEKIQIKRFVPGLKFYILHNPAVGNTPMGDRAFVSLDSAPGQGLFASQGNFAQAVVFSTPLKQVTAGFEGTPSDGHRDLREDFKLQSHYQTASNGNVVLTAWIDIPESVGSSDLAVVIGFGQDLQGAYQTAKASMEHDLAATLEKYVSQWQGYQSRVRDLSESSLDQGALFRASVSVLKSMEDKTYSGAFVASPTVPWGEHQNDNSASVGGPRSNGAVVGGYHLVWPRDLYQMATSFLAIDDPQTATACLNFLKGVQLNSSHGNWQYSFRRRSKDGSFFQNTWVNGEPYWTGLQLDEVAMPVILAYRLWKKGEIQLQTYWDTVKRAGDFIADFGPWTAQERWEEAFGASPSTIASEIAALWVAAEMAGQMGDSTKAQKFRSTADAWSSKPGDNLESWTFTSSGSRGNGRYFIRIEAAAAFDQLWNPNDDAMFNLANNAGVWREKDVVDAGFLELVRFGVRSALADSIVASIPVVDQSIRVEVPGKGPGFRRYSGDRYNYEDASGNQTPGMPWPLLSGERGQYELTRAVQKGLSPAKIDQAVLPYLKAMQNFATPSLMIPEQVWDGGPGAGMSTGSATPLGWSHGEYLKLLRSRADQQPIDLIPSVFERSQKHGH